MISINTNLRKDQAGFVSIIISLTIVIVLALITVGFAQISRREQQQSLNKQLNSQAYYAAESGINDAYQLVKTNKISKDTLVPNINDGKKCVKLSSIPGSNYSENVNSSNGVTYSCVLINIEPPDLHYTNVTKDTNQRNTFSTNGTLGTLNISWVTNGATAYPADLGSKFPKNDVWNASHWPAVIEMKLTPIIAEPFTQADLLDKTFTVFLYPASSGGDPDSVDYAAGSDLSNQGKIISGHCSAATGCNASIKNIIPAAKYLISFHTYYTAADDVTISPETSGGAKLLMVGGQVQIDVTGKAQDVLKRLQVRKKIGDDSSVGNFAIEAQSICKRIKTYGAATSYENPDGSNAGAGNVCNPETDP